MSFKTAFVMLRGAGALSFFQSVAGAKDSIDLVPSLMHFSNLKQLRSCATNGLPVSAPRAGVSYFVRAKSCREEGRRKTREAANWRPLGLHQPQCTRP